MTAPSPDDKDGITSERVSRAQTEIERWFACVARDGSTCGAAAQDTRRIVNGLVDYFISRIPAPLPECGTLEFWKNEAGRFEESNRQAQEAIDDMRQKLAECELVLAAWHKVFETSQLSHAHARLQAAEEAVARSTSGLTDKPVATLLSAAVSALRSYEYGNCDPTLAKSVADKISADMNSALSARQERKDG